MTKRAAYQIVIDTILDTRLSPEQIREKVGAVFVATGYDQVLGAFIDLDRYE